MMRTAEHAHLASAMRENSATVSAPRQWADDFRAEDAYLFATMPGGVRFGVVSMGLTGAPGR